MEFDIVVLIYFRTKTFELLSNPLQKQKINNKIMVCVRNVCLYFAALVSVYLLACVEPCISFRSRSLKVRLLKYVTFPVWLQLCSM